MAARRGVPVIGVDPAYTSKWGRQHWLHPLPQQTSDLSTVTGHHGAAAAIGRPGLGMAAVVIGVISLMVAALAWRFKWEI